MRNILLFVLLSLLVTSCGTKYIETDPDRVAMVHSSPTFKGQFYLGSDETHHFFIEKWKYGRDRKFKVKKELLKVYDELPENSCEIMLWPLNSEKGNVEEFGESNKRKFYKIKT